MNEGEKDYDDGKDEGAGLNLLTMIARTNDWRLRAAVLPPCVPSSFFFFSLFNRARERASGIIYKPVLFPKPRVSVDGNANNSPGSRALKKNRRAGTGFARGEGEGVISHLSSL